MDFTLESKACVACARAKRRCGKQIPTCGRCTSRSIACEYPPAKAFYLPPRQPIPATDVLFDMPGDSMATDHRYPLHLDDMETAPSLPWYLDEISWEIDHRPDTEDPPIFASTVLLNHIDAIQGWQSRWIRTASNPYIHPNIYRFHMPRCVQDAYTTLSTYVQRTPENRMAVARIVEDRVRQLLDDQPSAIAGNQLGMHETLDLLDHLARVHALHVYQTIGLYDGDIRLRHVAETQIPTLNSWLRQLFHSAKSAAAQGLQSFVLPLLVPSKLDRRILYPSSLATQPGPHLGQDRSSNDDAAVTPRLSQEELEWYGWSFAETIRRTWMVCTALQTVYLTLQIRHAPCPGGTMFSAREGLWDAKTAYAWAFKCEKSGGVRRGVDFVNRTQWSGMFENCRPEDMDEFSREALEITYGPERVERWRTRMGASGETGA